jgi:5-methylthioribose kinase
MAYAILDKNSAVDYTVRNLRFFSDSRRLCCRDISDGNLNTVFRVSEQPTGKSVILKQGLPYARTSHDMPLSAQRCKTEAEALKLFGTYAEAMVPQVYDYNAELCVMAMEDLKDYEILRTGLLQQKQYPSLARDAAGYFANCLLKSSDIVLPGNEKKEMAVRFSNKELCALTERLVLTSPTYDDPRHSAGKELRAYLQQHLWNDEAVIKEFAVMKHIFMTKAQALLHGDAHSGSIFINEHGLKFIDAEFAFYGPMGFDVGMLTANLIMNAVYHAAHGKADYYKWIEAVTACFIDNFKEEFHEVWQRYATEKLAKESTGFRFWYLDDILKDTAGFCACEMIRRTIGSAPVKEMTDYTDDGQKLNAQQKVIDMAKKLLLNRGQFTGGQNYAALMKTNF